MEIDPRVAPGGQKSTTAIVACRPCLHWGQNNNNNSKRQLNNNNTKQQILIELKPELLIAEYTWAYLSDSYR